jgi:cytochrome c oxidase subunit II
MQVFRRCQAAFLTLLLAVPMLLLVAPGGTALAQAPRPWEMSMQPAFSPVKQDIIDLHNLVLVIITLITLLVGGLLGWVMYRYHETRNPVPGHATHNTVIEVAWTVIPVLILVVMAIPSFRLVYYEDRTYDPDMTIKVTGHQWYWEYTYPDNGNLDFNSNVVADKDLKQGQPRLLTVDNPLVIPVNTTIRVQVAGGDVIHSWFVPSFGVQEYAVIGRLNEAWMQVLRTGTYYGECNQICGVNHAFMPIEVVVKSQDDFQKWLTEAKTKFSSLDKPKDNATQVAAADPGTAVLPVTDKSVQAGN